MRGDSCKFGCPSGSRLYEQVKFLLQVIEDGGETVQNLEKLEDIREEYEDNPVDQHPTGTTLGEGRGRYFTQG